ncbi:MAG: CBS domain-containing protein [Ardenticatenaceae bacterium]|nr:CBS domain-containing protein [Anaerolineales bacterium]MCB8922436.1 CBS domain-containing protein [Ardenticatenaceae bacterium]MCB9005591.1 CBS domain-containing protein [Ardenticatenaceae bacterium]
MERIISHYPVLILRPSSLILYNGVMLLILTHENADFDAVASQLAAHKLYPTGIPLLPRRLNRNVQQFLTLYWSNLPFMQPEDWRKKRVDDLVLVDTQTPLSVRGVARHPAVRVIDHHIGHAPKPGWHYQVEAVGATTTLLVERLQTAGLRLLAEEATLLLLGIYEDTGSLTYDTTTARDAQAAAWLLEQGAQLNVVRRFLNIPLTPEQQTLYEALQTAVEWVRIGGHQIAVTAAATPNDFNDEISSVAHRLRDALQPVALFVLVQIGQDVQLVARSSDDYVDVARIAGALGGGGHSRAAAALVTKQSVMAVRRRVLQLLPDVVQPQDRVAQIMSHGVQTITADTMVADAAILMQRFGYEGYPVLDEAGQRLVGLLTRRVVDRAVNHDMARFPVQRVMKTGSVTVRPSDSIERVQQLMLSEGWGQIPVIPDEATEDGPCHLIGIVTRTDLLNHLFQPVEKTAVAHMRDRLEKKLSPPMWNMVLAASAAAADLDMPLYFVGGLVRDLLLDIPAKDLDMVVEGDAIALVRRLQKQFDGQVHTHRRFGTAKWFTTPDIWQAVLGNGEINDPVLLPDSIDFVTARTEFYREPSALPEVERGSIKLDLHRRDFTINTLAVRLDGAHLGELLDFYGGQRDLAQRLIRVLHSISFVDDPTRMLRAVRLEQRLEFAIEPRTAELLIDALPMLDRVTGDRIRHEIELALRETRPVRAMARLAELGILAQIHPQLAWPSQTAVSFARVSALLIDPTWRAVLRGDSPAFVYFALWMAGLPPEVQAGTMQRLRVRKTTRDDVTAAAELMHTLHQMTGDECPSEVERRLRPYQPRVLLVGRVSIGAGPIADLVEQYYREWRLVKTAVNGDDLRAMGHKPGPEYAIWLDALLAARLDGRVHSREDELALLKETVRET